VSIFSDLFTADGLAACGRALGDDTLLDEARQTCIRIAERLRMPDFSATKPYGIKPGEKLQGVTFIFLNVLTTLLQLKKDGLLEKEANRCVHEIIDHHMDPVRGLNIEKLNADYQVPDSPEDRDYQPGHGIECSWMLMLEGLRREDKTLLEKAFTMLKWHIDKGWDNNYGGFFWFLNIDGVTPCKDDWDCKPWWSPAEALFALILAYELTGDKWYSDWFERVHEYAFRTFSDSDNGEWHQKCDRYGKPVDSVIALPVKDPFHLPRAVMFIIQSLNRQLNHTPYIMA
jgi:N-acylglucosamine 2-epimerase